ncbi:MAG: V-type ATP synthase subunit C [Bacillota bacterium]|nr:V-type ATP synthase subunit C [Bacillota bacterium]MDD3298738.1 V-type ATP synthase subunit C [Bacillota bacterium]MDD3850567.1 V-type ATP synthase subunit C [Bacillota bacterium]MDD4707328.1 V-type ATP synthase subunit C [Bacillota bacterium]
MRDTMFLYAVSRVKALENNLLSRSTVDRMLEALSPDEALKILGETDYGNYFGEVDSVYDFEKALDQSLRAAYKVIEDSTGDERLTLLFRLRYDFHNLKVLMKEKYLGEDFKSILSQAGSISVEALRKAVDDKDMVGFAPHIREAYERADVDFELNGDPRTIDMILDGGLYAYLLELVKDIKDDGLMEFVRTEIDLLNINTLLRIRKTGGNVKVLETALFDGGFLDRSALLGSVGEPVGSFADRLSSTRYDRVAVEGIGSFIDTDSTTVLEKITDDLLLNMAKKGKYAAFGILPIIGYLWAKENEARVIRMIMVGKINGIPAESLRERLRDLYV